MIPFEKVTTPPSHTPQKKIVPSDVSVARHDDPDRRAARQLNDEKHPLPKRTEPNPVRRQGEKNGSPNRLLVWYDVCREASQSWFFRRDNCAETSNAMTHEKIRKVSRINGQAMPGEPPPNRPTSFPRPKSVPITRGKKRHAPTEVIKPNWTVRAVRNWTFKILS